MKFIIHGLISALLSFLLVLLISPLFTEFLLGSIYIITAKAKDDAVPKKGASSFVFLSISAGAGI